MKALFSPLLVGCMLTLAVTVSLCLIKAIIGPRLIDRLIAGNMIGVKTISVIAMLAVYLEEWYLLDICLVYALISFLAVVVLTMINQKPGRGRLTDRLHALKKTSEEVPQDA
ncbi:MAG: monovalent cation/H+ antiporter complex subunit F [Angelakisella sp.]